MLEIYQKFISDLDLPEDVITSLDTPRNHAEMRVFTLSLPRLTCPDTYILAGRLYIYLNIITAPRTISDYVEIANDMLRSEISSFLLLHNGILDTLLEETWYKNFEDHSILSASKCIDYLLHVSKHDPPIETPCQLALRQAVQFHHDETIEKVIKVYREIINLEYVHASPTMFNAGLRKNQMSSCFLLNLGDDLEDLLYTGAGDVGIISKLQGGIGLSMNRIRHSAISNTGKSSGVLPFARIYDSTIRCVDQGGKRNGAATISLNDWHIDAEDFIQARDNYNHNGIRLIQANTALFVSSLFMRRVRKGQKWTLFCPAKANIGQESLVGLRGDRFENLYCRLEEEVFLREEMLNQINIQIENVEIEAFSPDATEDTIKRLNLLNCQRVKVRKNMIDYKVVDARKMYELICDMQVKSSFPYIVYADTMNYKNNTMNIGPTESSNLCVAPETLILTDKGQLPIGDLQDQTVNVWNGKEFSEVVVKKTGENQELVKVILDDGSFLECTKYHKFYIQNSYQEKTKTDILHTKSVEKIEAQHLQKDMKLVKCNYPIIDSGPSLKNAYTNGFFTGDGTHMRCSKEIKQCDANISKGEDLGNRMTISLPRDIEKKFFVPINYDLKSKLDWLAGFSDADGCVLMNGNNQGVQLTSINEDFMREVKMMLQTCGCNPKISLCSDGHGGQKYYDTKKCYRMVISSFDIQTLIANGFETRRLVLQEEHVQRKDAQFVKVSDMVYMGRISDTFCFTEHKRNAGIFGGIFCMNCLEITLPASPSQIASCNLAHVNLSRYVDKNTYDFDRLGKATQSTVDNVDKVITYNYYPLDERDRDGNVTEFGKIHKPNIANRPEGIGVSGLAEAFALLNIPYDSQEAIELNKKIFACMYFNALYKSWELAKQHGEYETFRTGKSRLFMDGEFREMDGSPLSNGFFQFDLWRSEAEYLDSIGELQKEIYCPEDDIPIDPAEWGNTLPIKSWEELRELIKKDGVRNSMLLALMPTASSAQLLRNAETTEAHQTLIYSRKLVHGNYMAFSEPLIYDLKRLKLLNKKMIDFINISNGTIKDIHFFIAQNPDFFPDLSWKDGKLPKELLQEIMHLQKIHKGMFEISQKITAKMARQRGIYVDQSQSFNIYIDEPSIKKLQAVHLYTDALRLKTGMYYLRANSAIQTGRFTVDSDVQKYHSELDERRSSYVCSQDECLMCS